VIAVIGWQTLGICVVVQMAGLQASLRDLIDASRIDGCGPVTSFRRVTWPLLAPSLTIKATLGSTMVSQPTTSSSCEEEPDRQEKHRPWLQRSSGSDSLSIESVWLWPWRSSCSVWLRALRRSWLEPCRDERCRVECRQNAIPKTAVLGATNAAGDSGSASDVRSGCLRAFRNTSMHDS
jgi:hypothetical protein